MADPKPPVSLDEIEARPLRAPWTYDPVRIHLTAKERDEGLADITRDPVWPADIADDALAAVRELVDLGEGTTDGDL